MACINARLGNPPLARKWLERARSANTLPARTQIDASAYMADLRRHAWFQEFVARID
jgi:hypothetical protein